MKKYIISAFCTLISVGVFAQGETKSLLKQFEYTLSVGFGTTALSEPYDEAIFNFNAGIDVKKDFISFSNENVKLYGLAGLQLTQRGGKIDTSIDGWLASGNSLRITQINIPVYVGLKYTFKNDWRIFVDCGPYIGYNTSSHLSEGFGDNDYVIKTKDIDAGLGFNMGICFKRFGLSFGLQEGLLSIAEFKSETMEMSKDLKSTGFYFKFQWTFNKQ